MPCLLLFGATGMGKTEIVSRFSKLHAPQFDIRTGLSKMPVLLAQIPPEPSEEQFYTEVLTALNCVDLSRLSVRSMRAEARQLLAEVETKVLVLDEIDKMLAGTPRQQRVFLNTIRFLTNDLKIPIVCAGTEDARMAVLMDPNLADRFGAFELMPWRNDHALRQLLASFSGLLPLRRPSMLDTVEARQRVLALTQGVTGRIFRLIEAAAVTAIRDGREMLDAASFEANDVTLPLVSMFTSAGKRRTIGRATV
jgi:replication-associated recombination protein RarA